MRFKSYLTLFTFSAVLFVSCKKTDLQNPLTVKESEVYTPPGYDPSLLHTRKTIVNTSNAINGLFKNPLNESEIYLYGYFGGLQAVDGSSIAYSYKVCVYNSSSNALVNYPSNLSYSSEVYSFITGSNGFDYLGGQLNDNGSSAYMSMAKKSHYSSPLQLNVGQVNNNAKAIIEFGGKIYFTGDFNYFGNPSTYCSPVLCYDPSNGSVTEFGSYSGSWYSHNTLAFYHNIMYLGESSQYGNIARSSGGSWSIAAGGFNGSVNKIAVDNDKLYVAGGMTKTYNNIYSVNFVNVLNEANNTWDKVGINNLPGTCNDIAFSGSDIYAAGYGYIYKLDKATNKWRSILASDVSTQNILQLVVSNGKVYTLEYNGYYQLVSYSE